MYNSLLHLLPENWFFYLSTFNIRFFKISTQVLVVRVTFTFINIFPRYFYLEYDFGYFLQHRYLTPKYTNTVGICNIPCIVLEYLTNYILQLQQNSQNNIREKKQHGKWSWKYSFMLKCPWHMFIEGEENYCLQTRNPKIKINSLFHIWGHCVGLW